MEVFQRNNRLQSEGTSWKATSLWNVCRGKVDLRHFVPRCSENASRASRADLAALASKELPHQEYVVHVTEQSTRPKLAAQTRGSPRCRRGTAEGGPSHRRPGKLTSCSSRACSTIRASAWKQGSFKGQSSLPHTTLSFRPLRQKTRVC